MEQWAVRFQRAEQTSTASQRGHNLQSEGPIPLPGQGSALSTCPVQRDSTQFTVSEGSKAISALSFISPSPFTSGTARATHGRVSGREDQVQEV